MSGANPPDGGAERALRFLALGDSYTIGEGVQAEDRWPEQLVVRLRAHGVVMRPPQIIARTAWTTDELADAIAEANPTGPFDLVTLMIGVNDQYRARPVEQFEAGFTPLLERAVSLADGHPDRLVVLSIPDWGHTPFAEGRDLARISLEIEQFNEHAERRVRARGARWHDVTALSRETLRDPQLVVSDGLHPSGAMYRRWAESLVPVITGMFREPDQARGA